MALSRLLAIAAMAAGAAAASPVLAQSPADAFAPKEESVESLPPGPGREAAFGMCGACHAYRLVAAQGMSRERWNETITVMVEKHGMPKIAGEQREKILSYLAAAHPPKAPTGSGGFKIPFEAK